MGLFNKGSNKPSFNKYSEQHFKNGVHRILWKDEDFLADGFFEEGPDPMGEEDGLKGFFGANTHTYLVVTNWRIILGYLTNGNFSSHEFSNTSPQIRRTGSKIYFTYSDPNLKAMRSPTYRSTYAISKEVAEAIERSFDGVKPERTEESQIQLSRKSWGEGPLADLAKVKSGRDYMLVEVCSACSATMMVPDDIESSPEKGNSGCTTCLRAKKIK